jgi:DNA-binding CsgD family transcriptional regulator
MENTMSRDSGIVEERGAEAETAIQAEAADNMGGSLQGARQASQAVTHEPVRQQPLFAVESEDADNLSELEKKALTPRQRQMLSLYRDLRSSNKVAVELKLSADHAKKALRKISVKLGCNTVLDLLDDPGSRQDSVTGASLLALLESQEYRCALSGVQLTPKTAQLDHKTPRSKGGEHVMGNVWFLHRDVNRAKGTMTVDEFIKMCSRVVQWKG